jgi:tetratricopeptide (TPR) repeat protein
VPPILASAVVMVIVLAVTFKRKPEDPVRATSVATAASDGLSPARQLLERARPLAYRAESRSDLDAAQGLIEQAAKLDPNDASIWAEWAIVDTKDLDFWLDHSETRKAAAQMHAERAMSLDPLSRDARFARAVTMVSISEYDPAAKAEAAEILRSLVAEKPQDGAALLSLGYAVNSPDRLDEALALFDRAARLPGMASQAALGKWVAYFYAGHYAQAEKVLDESLAVDASQVDDGSLERLGVKIFMTLIWRGDLDGAARLERQMPTSWRMESMGVMINWYVYTYRREPEKALAALRMVTSDELHSNLYSGPKGVLVGDLLEMGGHTDAAQVEWNVVLKSIEQRYESAPNDRGLLEMKIGLLSRLGQRAEADRLWRLDLGLYGDNLTRGARPRMLVMLEPVDRAIDVLEKSVRGPFDNTVPTAAMLRYDPMYDPLRKSPRFAALIALAEADPRLSPKAAGKSAEKSDVP